MKHAVNHPAREIAAALAAQAEAVCRHYLSHGHKEGRYWLVGNVHNAPGRSLFVRLAVSLDGGGAAGKWTDAASGEHGDLLDIIAAACSHGSLAETLSEARRFLSLPQPVSPAYRPDPEAGRRAKEPGGSPQAAVRLFSATLPLAGTLAARQLAARGITNLAGCEALRFHPHCYYRRSSEDRADVRPAYPAMIAAVTDLAGSLTGVHRSWLAPYGSGKAPVAYPRRAMGLLLGHAVRFGCAGDVLIAGEGIETVLSLRQVMPALPMAAALSANHLAAILFPAGLKRLYVARDDDPAGTGAVKTLVQRGLAAGVDVIPLEPMLGDFNEDLTGCERQRMVGSLRSQLMAGDAANFLRS